MAAKLPSNNGVIFGIVSEEGVIKPNTPLILTDHATLRPIARTVTDVNGGYVFANLDVAKTDYMIFTIDNDGATPKNAMIRDYITPTESTNGTLRGNFTSALDASNPLFSRTVLRRQQASTLVETYAVTGHGALSASFLGGSAKTVVPSGGTGPIPTNDQLGVWSVGAGTTAAFTIDRSGSQTDETELKRGVTTPDFSMMATIFNQATVPTQVTTHRKWLYEVNDYYNWNFNSGGFYHAMSTPTSVAVYPNDLAMRVVSTGTQLKICWVQDRGALIPTIIRQETICALDDNKWYMVFVRIASADWASANGMKVTVVDITDGITTDYSVAAAAVSWSTANVNSTSGVYGGHWSANTAGALCGMAVAGAFATGTFSASSAGNTGGLYNVNSHQNIAATKTAYVGPMAFWGRKLSDAEVTDLITAATNTTTSKRFYPIWLSELSALGPEWHLSFDDDVSNRSLHRNDIGGCRRALFALPPWSGQQPASTYSAGYTGRRRNIVKTDGVRAMTRMYAINKYAEAVTVVIGFHKSGALSGSQVFYGGWVITQNSTSQINQIDYHTSANRKTADNCYIQSNGTITLSRVDTAFTVRNYSFAVGAWADGQHIIAIRLPYGQTTVVTAAQLWVDGVYWGTSTGDLASSGVGMQDGAGLGSYSRYEGGLLFDYTGGAANSRFIEGTPNTSISTADIAIFKGCLHTDDIADLSAAWLLATGTDSRA